MNIDVTTEHGQTDPPSEAQSFEFWACMPLLKTTGKEASSIDELRQRLGEVSDASVMHHMNHFFIKSHLLEYSNDFARWAGEQLEERILAERLSIIDPYVRGGADNLRALLINTLDRHLQEFPEPRPAIPGEEFIFLESVSLSFSTGMSASSLSELLTALKQVEPVSIYYHFYEARVRHGGGDFARWIEEQLGEHDLAMRIRSIDPFVNTVEGVRTRIIEEIERSLDKKKAGERS
jgi:hypothetical protein